MSDPQLGSRQLDPERLGDHVTRLYRAAYGLCGSREDAEDLVQSTYERVLRRPRFVRHDQDLAYLLRVMRNTWISSARAKRAALVPLDADDADEFPIRTATAPLRRSTPAPSSTRCGS